MTRDRVDRLCAWFAGQIIGFPHRYTVGLRLVWLLLQSDPRSVVWCSCGGVGCYSRWQWCHWIVVGDLGGEGSGERGKVWLTTKVAVLSTWEDSLPDNKCAPQNCKLHTQYIIWKPSTIYCSSCPIYGSRYLAQATLKNIASETCTGIIHAHIPQVCACVSEYCSFFYTSGSSALAGYGAAHPVLRLHSSSLSDTSTTSLFGDYRVVVQVLPGFRTIMFIEE